MFDHEMESHAFALGARRGGSRGYDAVRAYPFAHTSDFREFIEDKRKLAVAQSGQSPKQPDQD